ncbi:MAG: hypothetical protein ACOVNL_09870 [Prochlorococcaceae cyanobacterium]|jgi:hypothetical protein
MATTEDTARGQTAPSGTPPEFLAWAESHQRQERRHGAELAQISRHPQGTEQRSALEEEEIRVQEHEHERRLHDSALAQLRHPRPEGDPAAQGS